MLSRNKSIKIIYYGQLNPAPSFHGPLPAKEKRKKAPEDDRDLGGVENGDMYVPKMAPHQEVEKEEEEKEERRGKAGR